MTCCSRARPPQQTILKKIAQGINDSDAPSKRAQRAQPARRHASPPDATTREAPASPHHRPARTTGPPAPPARTTGPPAPPASPHHRPARTTGPPAPVRRPCAGNPGPRDRSENPSRHRAPAMDLAIHRIRQRCPCDGCGNPSGKTGMKPRIHRTPSRPAAMKPGTHRTATPHRGTSSPSRPAQQPLPRAPASPRAARPRTTRTQHQQSPYVRNP
jgi:hypothetical protein